jgi:hypothetical protein
MVPSEQCTPLFVKSGRCASDVRLRLGAGLTDGRRRVGHRMSWEPPTCALRIRNTCLRTGGFLPRLVLLLLRALRISQLSLRSCTNARDPRAYPMTGLDGCDFCAMHLTIPRLACGATTSHVFGQSSNIPQHSRNQTCRRRLRISELQCFLES